MKGSGDYIMAVVTAVLLVVFVVDYEMSHTWWGLSESAQAVPPEVCLVNFEELNEPVKSSGISNLGSEGKTCEKCGHVIDSELCCKPYQTLCTICGLVKASPGCSINTM